MMRVFLKNKKVSYDASLLEKESLDGGKSGLDRHPYIPSCKTIRDLHGEEFMRMFLNVSIYCFGFALDHQGPARGRAYEDAL